jgi:hypothetical protein
VTVSRPIAVALAAAALALPATAQAKPAEEQAGGGQVPTQTQPRQDLRSPDARDAAERRPVVVQVPAAPDTGFEWDSAALGALAGAGLMLSIAGGGVLIVRRRPRAARPA